MSKAEDLLIGGWELGSVINARSGVPMDVLITRPDKGSTWPAKFVSRAAFIGCVGLQDDGVSGRLTGAFSKDWDKVRSLHLDKSPDDTSWFAGDGWWLSTSEPPGEDIKAA